MSNRLNDGYVIYRWYSMQIGIHMTAYGTHYVGGGMDPRFTTIASKLQSVGYGMNQHKRPFVCTAQFVLARPRSLSRCHQFSRFFFSYNTFHLRIFLLNSDASVREMARYACSSSAFKQCTPLPRSLLLITETCSTPRGYVHA